MGWTNLLSPCLICNSPAVKTTSNETNLLKLLYTTLQCPALLSLEINSGITNSDFCETCSSTLICSMNILDRIANLNKSLEDMRDQLKTCIVAEYKKKCRGRQEGSRFLVRKTLSQCFSPCQVDVVPLERKGDEDEDDGNRLDSERESLVDEVKYEKSFLDELDEVDDFLAFPIETDVSLMEVGYVCEIGDFDEAGLDDSSPAVLAEIEPKVPSVANEERVTISEATSGKEGILYENEQRPGDPTPRTRTLKRKASMILKNESKNRNVGIFGVKSRSPDTGKRLPASHYETDEESKRETTETNNDESEMKRNVEDAKKLPYFCEICDRGFQRSQTYVAHKNRHLGNFPYPCTFCDMKFVYGWRLYHHIRMRHKNKQREYFAIKKKARLPNCPHCGLAFSVDPQAGENHTQPSEVDAGTGKIHKAPTLRELVDSRKSHIKNCYAATATTPEVRFQCSLCDKTLSSGRSLRIHIDTIHNKKSQEESLSYNCSVCGKEWDQSVKLKRHMVTVHQDPTQGFLCGICGKVFKLGKSFQVHQQRHTKSRSAICEVCGKGFFDRRELRAHFSVHAIRKDFPCNLCGKLFASKLRVRVHIRQTHKRVKERTKEEIPETLDVIQN